VRRAFVTGAHGVVGRWLVEALLARGAGVSLLVRTPDRPSALALDGLEQRCTLVPGDVADPVRLQAALDGCDAVFHLAAQSIVGEALRSPLPTFETNVRGTWNVLEACRLAGVERVVVAASDKVYGPQTRTPYREDSELEAFYPYDVSKACVDLITRSYFRTYGVPVAVARMSNVYGPGDLERSRLVPELVASVVAGRTPVIRSDGSPERDFLFAEDAAAAYLAIADAVAAGAGAGEAFNVGGDRPHAVREVAELLVEVAGADLAPDYRGKGVPAGEIDRQWLDSGKLRALTGWAPRVGLREGLARTVAWYREHPAVLEERG
jgi:CDP-glucose 4,6-dehydratase